jgi:hypothetical protein
MSRRAPRIAWSIAVVAAALDLLCIPLIVVNRDAPVFSYIASPLGQIALSFVATGIALLGGAVAARHPGNAIGWTVLVTASCFALGRLAAHYGIYGMFTAPGALPAGGFAIWIGYELVLMSALAAVFIFLLFPNGRPASPRWTPIVWAAGLCAVVFVVSSALRPGSLDSPWGPFENPYGLGGDAGIAISGLQQISGAGALIFAMLGAVALVVRLRAARGVERQQLKFVVYPWALLSISLPFMYAWFSTPLFGKGLGFLDVAITVVVLILFAVLPAAAGFAILRYRLYDIDLLINRTVVYGATSAAIAVTFWFGIVALQPLLSRLTPGNEIAVAGSTLVSFALFQPIRRRVQDAVDRRFARSRYDAARTLDAFADRLRDEVDLDELRSDLIAAVRQTMAPAHASLWLRKRAR